MAAFYFLEPAVPIALGQNSIMDATKHPTILEKLEIDFVGWSDDCILETFPVYIMTLEASYKVEKKSLTGIKFKDVECRKEYPFEVLHPHRLLPKYMWMEVIGEALHADFGLIENQLVVSDAALDLLKQCGLTECGIDKVSPN